MMDIREKVDKPHSKAGHLQVAKHGQAYMPSFVYARPARAWAHVDKKRMAPGSEVDLFLGLSGDGASSSTRSSPRMFADESTVFGTVDDVPSLLTTSSTDSLP